jgi:hypothetical protein
LPALSVSLEIAAHSAAGRGVARNGVTADAGEGEEKTYVVRRGGQEHPVLPVHGQRLLAS